MVWWSVCTCFYISLSSSVVEGIGISCGEWIDGLWVSAWGCTDSDLMDTAVHNVVCREAMSTAGTSAQYSASPHATHNQCCYPTLTFHPLQLAINSVIRPKLPVAECLEVQARIDCRRNLTFTQMRIIYSSKWFFFLKAVKLQYKHFLKSAEGL